MTTSVLLLKALERFLTLLNFYTAFACLWHLYTFFWGSRTSLDMFVGCSTTLNFKDCYERYYCTWFLFYKRFLEFTDVLDRIFTFSFIWAYVFALPSGLSSSERFSNFLRLLKCFRLSFFCLMPNYICASGFNIDLIAQLFICPCPWVCALIPSKPHG